MQQKTIATPFYQTGWRLSISLRLDQLCAFGTEWHGSFNGVTISIEHLQHPGGSGWHSTSALFMDGCRLLVVLIATMTTPAYASLKQIRLAASTLMTHTTLPHELRTFYAIPL